jgi:hypothetical protein
LSIALVASTSAYGPTGFTTPAINTTGANLLIIAGIGFYDNTGGVPTIGSGLSIDHSQGYINAQVIGGAGQRPVPTSRSTRSK